VADTPTTATPKPTLGLTGLTSNAMALIAPGAFLWLTIGGQFLTGAPAAGMSMWFGILFALVLCLATAVAYAELSKLYPGAGSSYFFAEQAFLSKKKHFRLARISKFVVGWASHLYYWVYPGVMVGVTAMIVGYMIGQIDSHFSDGSHFSSSIPSPIFMWVFCIFFSFGVSYIAYRGVVGSTGVGVAINTTQIIALLIFSVMAIHHRTSHPEGSNIWVLNSAGVPTQYVQDTMPDPSNPPKMIPDPANPGKQMQDPATGIAIPKVDSKGNEVDVMGAVDAKGNPVNDASGNQVVVPTDADGNPPKVLPPGVAKAVPQLVTVSYQGGITKDPTTGIETFNYHNSAKSVVSPHKGGYVVIQACIAILILVGFESVTSMGEEARNAKRDIPKAVILSLIIQGGFCYLFEYFAANYYLNSGYTATTGGASSAPIGDIMQLVGASVFGSANGGWWFMMIEACTVFLALIGTTLSCVNTGARVTYAMGRDEEMGSHFGILHGKNATPHRAIWVLATLSAFLGILTVMFWFCGPGAQADTVIDGLPKNFLYKIGLFHNALSTKIPQSFLAITLISNFGTFLLYMMSCIIAVVAFHEHPMHNFLKHKIIPIFGLFANLLCMVFYLVGPIPGWKYSVTGMSWKEPYCALAVAALWGIYGAIYFLGGSKKSGKPVFIEAPPTTTASV
jgi:APA family basic amino acid/polyamine antiporter